MCMRGGQSAWVSVSSKCEWREHMGVHSVYMLKSVHAQVEMNMHGCECMCTGVTRFVHRQIGTG